MLPPQLQHGVRPRSLSMPAMAIGTSASSVLRSSVSATQSRSCWGWRRQADYASHIDPQFQRFCRYRTLKTRAKLLDKLRRRGRWDWDVNQRPFFSPRQVRLASHIGRPKWRYEEDGSEKKDAKETAEDDGFELSRREKEWKEQMEAMRKRIEQDPYEAVFGKRFEPFWSPLVPTWMREEMGLSRWSKPTEATRSYKPTSTQEETAVEALKKHRQPKRDSDAAHPNGQLTEYAYPENKSTTSKTVDPDSPNGQLTSYSYSRKKPSSNENPESPNGQLTSYSYTSATSWDSWTKKARRDEWDSLSGQRRRFEYDPISNRMVQVQVRTPMGSSLSAAVEDPALAEASSMKPVASSSTEDKSVAVDVPVKTAVESRKAIPVPTNTIDSSEKKTSRYFPSLINSAELTLESSRTAAPDATEEPLEALTADDVRASMGRSKQSRNASKQESKLQTVLDRAASKPTYGTILPSSTTLQPAVERMQSKELPVAVELDDSAAHESTGEATDYASSNLPKDWEKQADLLQADRIRRTRGSSQASGNGKDASVTNKTRWIDIMNAKKAEYEAGMLAQQAAKEARDAEKNAKLEKANSILDAEIKDQKLRLLAYENRYAHGAIADIQQRLQASSSREAGNDQGLQRELERYQQKIRDLRKELDTSFKQSSVNSEMHLERIRDLEKDLAARNFGDNTLQVEKDRYKQKTKALKEELDRTFRQSSVNSEMQVERIRDLERELREARSGKSEPAKGVEATRGEGDFCVNVTKYAKDNSKWYKKPCYVPEATGKPTRAEMEEAQVKSNQDALTREIKDIYETTYGPIDTMKAEKKSTDKALVKEIKDIYEAKYGAIDTMKSEQQVVEVETDVDLGKALADYEKEQEYDFTKPKRSFEAEIAAEEKAAHEAQALLDPYPLSHAEARTESRQLDQDVHGARSANEKAPQLLSTGPAAQAKIQWEEPPVYKLLAYDSGNDILTTAVTSSNVTGVETPISIPEALSQLYQPARFVPHFAELQREGFQVIYGTKDLLVFKKVKTAAVAGRPSLADHGLVGEKASGVAEAKSFPAGVNPIDGMSYVEPNTGSFASPTGFVGDRWDTISKSENESSKSSVTPKSVNPPPKEAGSIGEETDIRHYPRVKREEQVFSGSRLNRSAKRTLKREAKETKRKWRGWRSRIQWALGVGFAASAVAYGVGAIAERGERKKLERWEEVLQGKRSRWE